MVELRILLTWSGKIADPHIRHISLVAPRPACVTVDLPLESYVHWTSIVSPRLILG